MPKSSIPQPDAIRLRHMLDAAREARDFVQGRAEYDVGGDHKLVLSLVKEIEIVGEAASNVSQTTRRRLLQIPWQDVVDMRNRLIHAYFDIDMDIVWSTVQEDFPQILEQLQTILNDDKKT